MENKLTEETQWAKVTLLVLTGIVAAMQVGKGIAMMPSLTTAFKLDLASSGWVLSIFAVLGAVACGVVGALSNVVKVRSLVITGAIALLAGSGLGALANSFSLFLIARALEGAGFVLVSIAAPAALQGVTAGKDADVVMGLWSTFMPAGIMVAMLAAPFVDDWRFFWLMNTALLALIVAGNFMTTYGIRPDRVKGRGAIADASRRMFAVARMKGMGTLILLFIIYNIIYFSLTSFLPLLLEQQLSFTNDEAMIAGGLIVGVNVIGNIYAGTALKRGVRRWTILAATSVLIGITGFFMFRVTASATAAITICCLFSAAAGAIPAAIIGGAPKLMSSEGDAPIAIGLVMQGSNIGQVIGPIAIGVVLQAGGWTSASVLAAVAAFASLFISLMLRKTFNDVE